MRLHAGRDFTYDGFGNEMEFLPFAILTPGKSPTVECHDRLIIRSRRGVQRWLHHWRGLGDGLRNRGCGDATADLRDACKRKTRSGQEMATRYSHGLLLGISITLGDGRERGLASIDRTTSADHCSLEVDLCEPEVALGFDGLNVGGYSRPRIRQ